MSRFYFYCVNYAYFSQHSDDLRTWIRADTAMKPRVPDPMNDDVSTDSTCMGTSQKVYTVLYGLSPRYRDAKYFNPNIKSSQANIRNIIRTGPSCSHAPASLP